MFQIVWKFLANTRAEGDCDIHLFLCPERFNEINVIVSQRFFFRQLSGFKEMYFCLSGHFKEVNFVKEEACWDFKKWLLVARLKWWSDM